MNENEPRDAMQAVLAARIYAQRDLLPSHIRNPRGHAFHLDDAQELAGAILASGWAEQYVTSTPKEGDHV
jgi:hypothetical protein